MPIPRQFHSSEIQRLGEWQFVFVIPRESGKLKPIPWVSGWGSGEFREVLYLRLEVNLKFLFIEKIFLEKFF